MANYNKNEKEKKIHSSAKQFSFQGRYIISHHRIILKTPAENSKQNYKCILYNAIKRSQIIISKLWFLGSLKL
jgi:hypothetical protein